MQYFIITYKARESEKVYNNHCAVYLKHDIVNQLSTMESFYNT